MRRTFAALALLVACESDEPIGSPCGDGQVLCPTGVCVGEDDLCPADPLSLFANDDLYDTRLFHALGSDACGGMVHEGDAHIYRWEVHRAPGTLVMDIFSAVPDEPDRRLEIDFDSPTRLTRAREWQDVEKEPDEHFWSFDDQDRLLHYRVERVDGERARLDVQRRGPHIYARTDTTLDVATVDADGRIVHVDGFTTEVDAYVGAYADVEYGRFGPTRMEIRVAFFFATIALDYVYDEAGRLLRRDFGPRAGWDFVYDAGGRLLELTVVGLLTEEEPRTYRYDYDCD